MADKLLAANKIAADMLAIGACPECRGSGEMFGGFGCDQCDGTGTAFSIANPADRDAVVQMLGEKFGISLEYYISSDGGGWYASTPNDGRKYCSPYFDSYQEAMIAAVLAV